MVAHSRHSGFSLLELSIVLTIIAIVLAGGAVTFTANVVQHQRDETHAKLAVIQKALLDYSRAFNRIPCQADITVNERSTDIGWELGSPGACGDVNFTGVDATADIKAGMIPTKTLNLDDEYAFDGWGRRFLYVVDQRLTETDAFTEVDITDTENRIAVGTGSGGYNLTDSAVYVIVSHGENGHGAYPRVGGTTRIYSNSTSSNEWDNCECLLDEASPNFDHMFVQRMPIEGASGVTDVFDDIVVYATRRQMPMVD